MTINRSFARTTASELRLRPTSHAALHTKLDTFARTSPTQALLADWNVEDVRELRIGVFADEHGDDVVNLFCALQARRMLVPILSRNKCFHG